MHSKAPWLYRLTPGVQRPVWLEEEERRSRLLQEERAEEEERARRLQREAEVNEMRRRLQSLEEENLRLKMERENLQQSIAQPKGSSYGTPEDKDAVEVFSKEAETTKEEAQTPKGGLGEAGEKRQGGQEEGEAEDQKEESRGSAGAQLPMNEERKHDAEHGEAHGGHADYASADFGRSASERR